jgi:NAD(P)-dependent dehydrogenase (short-subunit alcohol dehydrogenase family)
MNMDDKIIMITGASSGIGKATALELAKREATIIMVCKDQERGETARKEIIEESNNPNVDLLICDLSSQKQIRNLVKTFKDKYKALHVLINNAGLVLRHRSLSEDRIEMNLAVNYLAPFLLTNLLLDVLKSSAPSRIINVTSAMHESSTLDIEDLQSEKKYNSYGTYGRSKAALVLFTYELSRKVEGTGVTVNAVHPGVIRSNLGRDMPYLAQLFTKIFFKSPEKGAETSIYLATSPDVEKLSGKYFKNKEPAKSSDQTYDEELAKKLWGISEKLVGLTS